MKSSDILTLYEYSLYLTVYMVRTAEVYGHLQATQPIKPPVPDGEL